MRVVCRANDVSAISNASVRERLSRSIHIVGPISDLVVGREYAVQALEARDEGLWVYLHSVAASDYPYPYPLELFDFSDERIPAGWMLRVDATRQHVVFKRAAFVEWMADEQFYERLVDGDPEAISAYNRARASG
jgi:hypothetical protein